jgi:hypothetical protein
MELEISRANIEEEYAEEMCLSEEEQLRRSEELTLTTTAQCSFLPR